MTETQLPGGPESPIHVNQQRIQLNVCFVGKVHSCFIRLVILSIPVCFRASETLWLYAFVYPTGFQSLSYLCTWWIELLAHWPSSSTTGLKSLPPSHLQSFHRSVSISQTQVCSLIISSTFPKCPVSGTFRSPWNAGLSFLLNHKENSLLLLCPLLLVLVTLLFIMRLNCKFYWQTYVVPQEPILNQLKSINHTVINFNGGVFPTHGK